MALVDCTIDGNISYGVVQPGQHVNDGVPIIRVNNVNNDQLQLTEVLRVAPEIEEKYKRTRLKGGEVLLTLVGSTGQSFVAPKELAGWNVPRAIAVIRPKDSVGADWINICLQSKHVQHFLDVRANTTVQKTLNLKDVRDIPIPIPPKPIKEHIESIAVNLQHKLELNRQLNQTLEQIAQAIFKSWFVDFDPVKAKIKAKQNGQDPERAAMRAISGKSDEQLDTWLATATPNQIKQLTVIASLFPDNLQESDMGNIPEGWMTKPLYDIATYINGAAYRSFKPNDEQRGLPIIKIAELKAGVTAQTKYSDVEMPEKYRLTRGDILFSWSGNPDTSIDTFIWTHGAAWLNQHIFKVVPHNDIERSFVLVMLKLLRPVFAEIARNKQTTGLGHVTVADLKHLRCVMPPKPMLSRWNDDIVPILERAFNAELEIQALTNLRNTLLPKLLSGEINLSETQSESEAVA
ncbi:MAG: restriction endonuclease subunit S [Candidatus Thiodiazotropha sp. (ex Dulcina madagascariensis)]|nr:restriction endonuclease subunit S [Candidatus Thiodiazotropha sp. (ex Dulcina madagascariensis)]